MESQTTGGLRVPSCCEIRYWRAQWTQRSRSRSRGPKRGQCSSFPLPHPRHLLRQSFTHVRFHSRQYRLLLRRSARLRLLHGHCLERQIYGRTSQFTAWLFSSLNPQSQAWIPSENLSESRPTLSSNSVWRPLGCSLALISLEATDRTLLVTCYSGVVHLHCSFCK